MIFTLHRYIFRELLRVFVLAVVGLTMILSLCSILRPVQEYGVGPRQVLTLMMCFMPITLTFVLPMGALFACALVYGRFASDNEIDACRASGISLLTLVYPGAALAIVVAIANLILSFYMLPHFVHLAEKSLKADAKQILFRNIQRRGYYKLPPWLIYADQADLVNNRLVGVVVVKVAGAGQETVYTADQARVRFNYRDGLNEVQVYVTNMFQIGPEGEGEFSVAESAISMEFNSMLGDSIRFKKIGEIKRIRADLMRFRPIERLALETYAQFTIELLAQDIESRIGGDPNNYYRLHSGEKIVEFTAGSVAVGSERVKLEGDIEVIVLDASGRLAPMRLKPGKASLHIEGNRLAPTLTMDLHNVLDERTGELKMLRHVIRGLVRPSSMEIKRSENENVLDAIQRASASLILKKGPSDELNFLKNAIDREIRRTLVQITAETHSRLVFGIGCVPMIIIGIGLGIIKKGGHLLTAFGASCIPAAVLIVCIVGGKQVTENLGAQSVSGLALMWGGLGFLLLLTAEIYRRLLKN